jgi:predicted transposase/invertase (TIGR01784 family)
MRSNHSKEFVSVLNKHNCVKALDKIDLNPLILYLADDPLTQNRQELLEAFSNQMEADVMESYIRRLVNETEQMGIRKGLVEGKKQGLLEGLQEGKQQGLQEGKQQGLREVVNKLLAHMNKKQISQMLSISMAEVDKLCS